MKKLILLTAFLYFVIPFSYAWPVVNVSLDAIASDADSTINNVEFSNSSKVATSVVSSISGVPDKAPSVNITSPLNGASYTALATIVLSADAKDKDGKVIRVDFYSGNTLIGTEENTPFLRKWSNVPAGDYFITAKATDNSGASTTSAAVHIVVLASNFLTVNITSPLNNANYISPATGATITLTAYAKGPNPIIKTGFYNGSTLIFTEYVSPYSNKWRNVPAGKYSITAKTTDSKGNVSTSVPIKISVVKQVPCSFANQPTFGFSFNGTNVANINNGVLDPQESASITVPDGGQYATSGHFNSSSSNLYDIRYVSGGGTLLFNGYPVSNVVITAGELTGTAGKYTISLTDAAISGTLRQTITPFTDLDNNGILDAGDCAGDPIIFTYTAIARPTFGFTFAGTNLPGAVNLANINNGRPDPGESSGVSLCQSGHYITSAYFHSSLSNLYNISVHITGAGLLVDNLKQAGDRVLTAAQLNAAEGFHSIALANNNIATTVIETTTPFTDVNNDGAFNAGDVAGDPINITYALSPQIFWYKDSDGDQHASEVIITCGTTPTAGYTLTRLPVDDCNDNVPTPCPDNNITVNITNPVNGARFTDLATILLSADAGVKNGTIKQVDFYERGRLILSEPAAPFYRKWYHVPAGEYFINAKAIDSAGNSTFSPTIHISVLLSDSFTVNVTKPANGAIFTATSTGASIILTADVKGPNDIVKTDFYNGNTLIFTENVFPYSNRWRDVPAGNYSITAKATDSKGNIVTSFPIAITVVDSPVSSVSSRRSSLNIKSATIAEKSMQIAPNPANNVLNIRTPGLQDSKQIIVSVISASGVIMQTKQLNNLIQTTQLNVSSLASGLYIIKIISGNTVMYRQFVKM